MSCMRNIEVYVPKGATVKNVPFKSLSSSMAKKIRVHLCQGRSEASDRQTVTLISPVELRSKAAGSRGSPPDHRPSTTPISPGQFCLPVVSSSVKAYKVLRLILTNHTMPPVHLSGPETDAVCPASLTQKNAFIIFNQKIFLSVKKSRGKQASSQNSALASDGPFPCFQTQQHQRAGRAPPLPDAADGSQHTAAGRTSDPPNRRPEEPSQQVLLQMSDPGDLQQPENTTHTPSDASEEPEGADDEESHEHLEAVGFLPTVESCLGFDFQLLAKEEKINHLRARLRQKEAALSVLKSKPSDQL